MHFDQFYVHSETLSHCSITEKMVTLMHGLRKLYTYLEGTGSLKSHKTKGMVMQTTNPFLHASTQMINDV